jgi:hypothetical protein
VKTVTCLFMREKQHLFMGGKKEAKTRHGMQHDKA